MTPATDDVVRVYTGPLMEVEAYQQVLTESGIQSKVVGTELTGGLGTAIPESIELWVHRGDTEKAIAAIKQHEEERGTPEHEGRRPPEGSHKFPHPVSDHKPGHAPVRKEPHVKQDPQG